MLSARTYSLILSSVVGCVACLLLPSSPIEKTGFMLTGGILTKSDSLIYGEGTVEKPYSLGAIRDQVSLKAPTPTQILLTDDPNQIFQSTPPSPLDLALILHNLKRLNQTSIAIGTPLHWTDPDAMSLQALDRQLDPIPHLITSSPLSRTTTPSPIPPAFRKASIPISKIHGNASLLPVVNRVSLPDAVLGNQNSIAGFSILDSEPTSKTPHLFARWNDRVVFSFTLLSALHHLKISHDSIEIHMGRHIDLKKDNLYIPIDAFGRIIHVPKIKSDNSFSLYPAENLIDAPDTEFSKVSFQPILIRNAQSNQELPSLDYSNSVSDIISILSNPADSFAITTLSRPSRTSELLFIAAIITWIFSLQSHLPGRSSLIYLFGTAIAILILHLIVVHFTATWIPTLPALASLTAASFFSRNKSNKARRKILRQIKQRNKKSRIPTTADLLDSFKNDRL